MVVSIKNENILRQNALFLHIRSFETVRRCVIVGSKISSNPCRYKIKKDDSKMFGIDQETGALSVLGQLTGLPSPSKFTLIIEARDLGKISLSSEAEVSMHIESSDACIFEKPFYRVELPENARVDVIFKQLHARCPKGKPIFSIVSGNNFTQFECDVNSGKRSIFRVYKKPLQSNVKLRTCIFHR